MEKGGLNKIKIMHDIGEKITTPQNQHNVSEGGSKFSVLNFVGEEESSGNMNNVLSRPTNKNPFANYEAISKSQASSGSKAQTNTKRRLW